MFHLHSKSGGNERIFRHFLGAKNNQELLKSFEEFQILGMKIHKVFWRLQRIAESLDYFPKIAMTPL